MRCSSKFPFQFEIYFDFTTSPTFLSFSFSRPSFGMGRIETLPRFPFDWFVCVCRCRRQIIAGHFGERWDASACDGMCDRCSSGGEGRARRTVDVAPRLRLVLRVLQRAAQQETRLTGKLRRLLSDPIRSRTSVSTAALRQWTIEEVQL